jgi:hypothetical protein
MGFGKPRAMLSFGVSNLRRLKLVPPIELKPITVLVGKTAAEKALS